MAGKTSAEDLEQLWAGDFGDAYVERNSQAQKGREGFWSERIEQLQPESVLEVGCNLGGNLRPLRDLLPAARLAGIDVNESALAACREAVSGAELEVASAYDIPFEDGTFDLVFTTGVLIHLPPGKVEEAMAEIVRCSGRYVLCGEYRADSEEEVHYRGHEGALFRRDYGGMYERLHPELSLLDSGFLPADDETSSWDDVTWWLFEKQA